MAEGTSWKPPPWAWLAVGGLVGTGGGWTITRTGEAPQEASSADCEEAEQTAQECATVVGLLLDQLAECDPIE